MILWLLLFLTAPAIASDEAVCPSSCSFSFSSDVDDYVCFCPPRSSYLCEQNQSYSEDTTPKAGVDSKGRRYYIEMEYTPKGWRISQKYY
jgi:hypothetical protein